MPSDAGGDPVKDDLHHFRLGVDGVFSDVADTTLDAREKQERDIER